MCFCLSSIDGRVGTKLEFVPIGTLVQGVRSLGIGKRVSLCFPCSIFFSYFVVAITVSNFSRDVFLYLTGSLINIPAWYYQIKDTAFFFLACTLKVMDGILSVGFWW